MNVGTIGLLLGIGIVVGFTLTWVICAVAGAADRRERERWRRMHENNDRALEHYGFERERERLGL